MQRRSPRTYPDKIDRLFDRLMDNEHTRLLVLMATVGLICLAWYLWRR